MTGDVDFVDIPVTCDPIRRIYADSDPFDLRVESDNAGWFPDLLHNSLNEQMMIRQTATTCHTLYIKGLTHNVYDYADTTAVCRNHLLDIISIVQKEAEERGLILVPASTGEIAEAFRLAHSSN
jgi:hypothetical protein